MRLSALELRIVKAKIRISITEYTDLFPCDCVP